MTVYKDLCYNKERRRRIVIKENNLSNNIIFHRTRRTWSWKFTTSKDGSVYSNCQKQMLQLCSGAKWHNLRQFKCLTSRWLAEGTLPASIQHKLFAIFSASQLDRISSDTELKLFCENQYVVNVTVASFLFPSGAGASITGCGKVLAVKTIPWAALCSLLLLESNSEEQLFYFNIYPKSIFR